MELFKLIEKSFILILISGLIIATTYFPFEVVSVMIAYQLVIDPYFAVYKKIIDKFIS